MRPYFPLTPIGMGTLQVECLSSFLHRLAVAHGVTRYQLVSHLQRWWVAETGEHLPRCQELRWDGYSPNVAIALRALQHATGQSLSNTTLIALRDACAGNCIGSIKHERSWCPGCFAEDIAAGSPTYDRLLWRIQGVERCSVHRLRLARTCAHCGSSQFRDKTWVDLHMCAVCGDLLNIEPSKRDYVAKPFFGEVQTEWLVAHLSSLHETAENPLSRFLNSVDVTDRQLTKELGDIFHARCHPARPQLTSLIAVATCFDVDLMQLLTEPEAAAKQAVLKLGSASPRRVRRPSSHLRKRRTLWLKDQLIAAIAAGPPYASTAELCRTRDYNVDSARNTFPELTAELSRRHHAWKEGESKRHLKNINSTLKRLQARGKQLTVKTFTKLVAHESGAPLHLVRKVVGSTSQA